MKHPMDLNARMDKPDSNTINRMLRLSILLVVLICSYIFFNPAFFNDSLASKHSANLQAGHLDLSHWDMKQQPLLDLTGDWPFFADMLITPQQLNSKHAKSLEPEYLNVPSSWNDVISAKAFPAQGHGVGSYWLSISGYSANDAPSLTINRSCSNAAVFFFPEGATAITAIAKLGQVASTAAHSLPYTGSTTIALPFANSGMHHLLIQVSNFHFRSGGLCGEITLGETTSLQQQTIINTAIQSMLIAMIIMATLYSLALFTQCPQNRSAMWLMLAGLSATTFFLSGSELPEQLITNTDPWIYEWRIKLNFIAINCAATSLLMFYAGNFAGYIHPLKLKINGGCSLLCILFLLLAPVSLLTALAYLFVTYWGLQGIAALWITSRALRDNKTYSKPMLVAITPLIFTIPFDSYQYNSSSHMPLLSLCALIFFIIVESLVTGRKFSQALKLVDTLSKNIQEEVDVRTCKLNNQNKKLEITQKALQSANESLKKLSITDGLTRVYNRMYFGNELRKEWRRSSRQSAQISILMIDVDNFKALNDSAGHLAGDKALHCIAKTLHNQFKRAGELVARYGGEEFIIMLPETNQRKALAAAESLRHAIEQLVIRYNGNSYSVTISIGVSTTTPSLNLSPEHLLETADSALYKAKNAGRNRVEIIPLLPSSAATNQTRHLK